MAKNLGKIKVEVIDKKSDGVTSGGRTGDINTDAVRRAVGASLSRSAVKLAGLAGLDGVAKTLISSLGKVTSAVNWLATSAVEKPVANKVAEKVVPKIVARVAPKTDKPIAQKIVERVATKTDKPLVQRIVERVVPRADKPVAQRIVERVAPKVVKPVAQKMVEQVAPKADKPIAQRIVERVAPKADKPIAQKIIGQVAPKADKPIAQKIVERVAPKTDKPVAQKIVEQVAPKADKPIAQKIVERVAPKTDKPVAQKIVDRVAPKTDKPVAQKIVERVAPKTDKPVAQKIVERVAPKVVKPVTKKVAGGVQPPLIIGERTARPATRKVLTLSERVGQAYKKQVDRPSGWVRRPAPSKHPAWSAHLRGESGRGDLASKAAGKVANKSMARFGARLAVGAGKVMRVLGAAMTNPFTIIAAILIGLFVVVAVAVAKFVQQIWKWSGDLMKTRDKLAAFSGALAASKARSGVNQLMRDIRSAKRLEKPLLAVSSQRGRIKNLWHPISDLMTVIKSIVVGTFLPIIEQLVAGLSKAAAAVTLFILAMKKPIKALAIIFRFLANILNKLSWLNPFGGATAFGVNMLATGFEGMLDAMEASNDALKDIFNELLNGNRQKASALINADMASTASRLTGKRTPQDKDYRWSPKFNTGGGTP